jgi:hypothetical protein
MARGGQGRRETAGLPHVRAPATAPPNATLRAARCTVPPAHVHRRRGLGHVHARDGSRARSRAAPTPEKTSLRLLASPRNASTRAG